MSIVLMIGRFLLGGFGLIKDAAMALFGWVKDHPAQAALIVTLFALWWQHGALQGVRKDLVAMTKAKDAEIASHRATKANYRLAQAEAAKLDRQNVDRVKREHAVALQNAENRYAINLVNERTAFGERLRTATTRSCTTGSGEGAAMSSLPVLSRGPVQDGGEAIVHVADAELGADNTLRLEALITAWKDAAAVDVNR